MDGSTIPRLLCAFGVVALLLWGIAAALRYEPWALLARSSSRRRLIDSVETTILSSTSSLHVVKILDAYYVLGSSNGGVSIICPLEKGGVEAHVRRSRARPPFWRDVIRKMRRKSARPSLPGGDRTKVR